MISTSEFRRGCKIELDGQPYIMTEFQHVKPGKGGAFVRTKLKNMITGAVLERTFRSSEKVARPDLEEKKMQYLYETDGQFYFMDTTTYDQMFFSEEDIGGDRDLLKENMECNVLFYRGNPVGVDIPMFIELAVAETEPGVRGDTASGGNKPARMETGAVIQVPLFITEGDIIKIDTRTRDYLERVR